MAPQDVMEQQAEFERQQFEVYEARRVAEEGHANTVVAAALTIAAIVLADYGRLHHHRWELAVGFGFALVGLLTTTVFGLLARFVSWDTPLPFGHIKRSKATMKPSDSVRLTQKQVRSFHSAGSRLELHRLVHAHWRARAKSAFELGEGKEELLRCAVPGLFLPLLYVLARVLYT